MKKTVIIVILSILCIASVAYAFIKQSEAEKNRLVYEEAKELAQKNLEEAKIEREMAIAGTEEAYRQQELANQARADLEECNRK